jgi:uncharacterized protein YndB with AHSA1/START domain
MSGELDPSRIIRIDRLIDAPRALVFEALSDPRHLDAWWGPDGFTNETHAMAFEVGGLWRYTMHGPDGKDWPNWIRYSEITAPERIAYEHGGEIGEPAHFTGLITLAEENGGTRITLTLILPTVEAKQAVVEFGAVEGGQQTLAKLDRFVTGLKPVG